VEDAALQQQQQRPATATATLSICLADSTHQSCRGTACLYVRRPRAKKMAFSVTPVIKQLDPTDCRRALGRRGRLSTASATSDSRMRLAY